MRKEQYTDMKKVFTGILAGVGLITFALIVLMIFNGFLGSQTDQSLISYYDQLHEGDSEFFIAEALDVDVETQFASATIGGTSSFWVSPTTKQACGSIGETTSSVSQIYYQTNCSGNPFYIGSLNSIMLIKFGYIHFVSK
jgi:hypothetical protein